MTQPAKPIQNIHEYLAELEDIPGTRVHALAIKAYAPGEMA